MGASSGDVLHIVDSLAFGGAQSILKDYFESRPDDKTLHLYALRAAPRQVNISHPNVHVNPSFARFSMAPLLELRRMVGREGVGVLHCHLFRSQVFGYILKALFFPQIALVFHEHGRVVGREGESVLEALMFRVFLRIAWRRVDWFICISDYTRSRLLQIVEGARRRASVVANPIPVYLRGNDAKDPADIRRSFAVPDGAYVVGFASRLVQRKGWRDFLDAVQALSAQLPVFFLLAGDGEDRDKVKRYIRHLGLEDSGRMIGYIDRMARFYRALDCFVMPSHWEPHGLAHLEAQRSGVPVVVSSVPGLSATVHDEVDALLFEAADPQALAACIHRIANDSTLRERLVAGGHANAAQYTMETFSSKLEKIHSTFRPEAATEKQTGFGADRKI
jgi:glycosyltransferase involved in cell wall biosynthesis